MKCISFVIPAFNEELNIFLLYDKLQKVMASLSYIYEIIFINDGSRDATWEKIVELAHRDARIKGINFSRNFGHQMALTAGYECASGDAIISMDADLQDPPEVIVNMIKVWEQGADIVYARRLGRSDGFLKKLTASLYYKMLDAISDVRLPRNVGDFRLINRRALDVLLQCNEKSRYLRGLVAWIGFKSEYVDFVRPNRTHGTSGYSVQKMIKLALDGIAGFSVFPLKLIGYVGIGLVMIASSVLSYMVISTLLFHCMYAGILWFLWIILFFIGLQSLTLWFLGEYIGRIYEEQKGRPLYIIREKINLL